MYLIEKEKRVRRGLTCCVAFVGLLLATPAALGDESAGKLPNYYSFFNKAGNFERLPAEVRRDEAIEQGQLTPIHVGEPVPDLRFPDASGKMIGPRDYIGKKNVVVIGSRAWW